MLVPVMLPLPGGPYFFIRKKVSKILDEKNAQLRAAPAPTFFATPNPLKYRRKHCAIFGKEFELMK